MTRRIIRVGSGDERRRSRVTAALVIGGLLLASALSGVDLVSGLDDLLEAATPAATPEAEVPAAETAAAATTDADGLVAATVTWVSDGDTLRVELNGATTHVRLLGIDTPESVAYDASQNSDQGRQAARHTEGLVHAGDTVWLQAGEVDHDRYGRILRWVWLQEPSDPGDEGEVRSKMLDAIVLRDGYAKTFWLEGRYKDLFERLESEAKASGAGLWATGEDWGRAGG
jgi:micrococcal nuclease